MKALFTIILRLVALISESLVLVNVFAVIPRSPFVNVMLVVLVNAFAVVIPRSPFTNLMLAVLLNVSAVIPRSPFANVMLVLLLLKAPPTIKFWLSALIVPLSR